MHPFLRPILEPWLPEMLAVYWPIIVEGSLVSVALGLIGCFLVVRGTSLLGDALSHSVLPGIVIGFLIGGSLHSPWILLGATAVGIGAAVLVQSVHTQSRVKEDASLGIIFTTLFALGVVLINLYAGQADLDPGCVLYGNIESFVVQPEAIRPMAVILALVLIGIVVFYRPLLVSTFDPALAVSLGIPAAVVHYALMGALSLSVVASFEAVGAILAVALLIMPGATARLWTDRMPPMLLIAAAHGVLATVVGYWLSHPAVLNTSASGAIAVAGFALFTASWLLSPRHGLLVRARVRRKLRRVVGSENLLKAIEELTVASDQPVAASRVQDEMRIEAKAFAGALTDAVSRGWVVRTPARTGGGGGGDPRHSSIALTPAGREQSRRIIRAHTLWEEFLQQQVGLPPDHVHDAAEWIEHHLDDERVQQLDRMVSPQPR